MDKKKRNSILRRSCKDDETTTEINLRNKQRRISFSEKKSVRVFSGEEEPKTWNNSFELSDRNEASNNSEVKNSGIEASATSLLCTTNELVNKSLHVTPVIDNTMEISLFEHEKMKLYQSSQSNQLRTVTTNIIKANTKVHSETKSENNSKSQTSHINASDNANLQDTNTNSIRPERFIYINDNSNKENIAPHRTEEYDKISNTKISDEKQEPTTTAAAAKKTEYDQIFTKPSEVTGQQISIMESSDLKDIYNIGKSQTVGYDISISSSLNNISGITSFDKSISLDIKSTEDELSSFIPPEYLQKCNKKLDFRQLNDQMGNGQIKMFSPNKAENINNVTKITNCPIRCLDDTETKENFYQFDDGESKTLQQQKQQQINRRTELDLTGLFNKTTEHKQKTIIFNECIESNTNTKDVDCITVENPKHAEPTRKSLAAQCTIFESIAIDNQSRVQQYFEQTAVDCIPMECSTVNAISFEPFQNSKPRRQTIVFDGESISDIECDDNAMQCLKEESREEIIQNSKFRTKNRYTHYFEKDEIEIEERLPTSTAQNLNDVDLQNQSNMNISAKEHSITEKEIPRNLQVSQKNLCTYFKEESSEANKPKSSSKNRYTNYFEDEGEMEIENTTHHEEKVFSNSKIQNFEGFESKNHTNFGISDKEQSIEEQEIPRKSQYFKEKSSEETVEKSKSSSKNRYTHYFEKDGEMDIETPTHVAEKGFPKHKTPNSLSLESKNQPNFNIFEREHSIEEQELQRKSQTTSQKNVEECLKHKSVVETIEKSKSFTKKNNTNYFEEDGEMEIEITTHVEEKVFPTSEISKFEGLETKNQSDFNISKRKHIIEEQDIPSKLQTTSQNDFDEYLTQKSAGETREKSKSSTKNRYTNYFENDGEMEIETTTDVGKKLFPTSEISRFEGLEPKNQSDFNISESENSIQNHEIPRKSPTSSQKNFEDYLEQKFAEKTIEISKSSTTNRYTNYFENDGEMEIVTATHLQEEVLPTNIINSSRNVNQSSIQIICETVTSPEIQKNVECLGLENGSSIDISSKEHSIEEEKISENVQNPQKIANGKKRKTVMFSESTNNIDIDMTPQRPSTAAFPFRKYAFSPATPHRSILEFERLEEEMKSEEIEIETPSDDVVGSPMELSKNSNKRTTINLTPNFPHSKKRPHALYNSFTFNDIDADLTLNNEQESESNNDIAAEMMAVSYADTNVNEIINPELQITTNNETCTQPFIASQQQTPARDGSRSRIPIYSGSAKRNSNHSISRKNVNSLFQLDNTMDTIQVPRFLLSGNISTNFMSEYSLTKEINNPKKSAKRSIFENDKPITISDVSEHYLSHRQRATLDAPMADQSIPETKIKSSIDNLLEIIESEAIEETKLDLIDSIFDSEIDDAESEAMAIINETKEIPMEECQKQSAMICRKCRRCQESVLNDTASTENVDSFVMPQLPPMPTFRFDLIAKYKRAPTLADIGELFERLELFQPIERESDVSVTDTTITEEVEDPFFEEYRKREKMIEENLKRLDDVTIMREPFVVRLQKLMSEPAMQNWILNAQMQVQQILRFTHRKIMSIFIILQYEEHDRLGLDVSISSINVEDNARSKRIWLPFDHILHFQLKLTLPSELHSLCSGNNECDVVNMLQHVDNICLETAQLTKELYDIVINNDSTLIREGNRNFIRKVIRRVRAPQGFYKKTDFIEFRIEITNIKNLSFKDIVLPALHMFKEVIRKLPPGLIFLHKILNDPLQYLNENEVPS